MRTEDKNYDTPVWTGELVTGSLLLGVICITVTERGLLEVTLTSDPAGVRTRLARRQGDSNSPIHARVPVYLKQVQEYLEGKRHHFDLPIDWSEMSPFQLKVLRETFSIPFGHVRTYRGLAGALGQPEASRAVGSALAANPIAVVIPCHRVIGTDRLLHGYGAPGGLDTKAWLLELEGWVVRGSRVLGERRVPL